MRTIRRDRHTISVSRPEKMLFPDDHVTKGDLIDYYQHSAPVMLPHFRDRLLTLERFPNGIDHEGFMQREVEGYYPTWIRRQTYRDKGGGTTTSAVCSNAATLVYLANQACITFHTWLSRTKKLAYPDRLVFDLDPSREDFAAARQTARTLGEILWELDLVPFVQTTGSRGLHVVVPLDAKTHVDTVRAFARDVVNVLMQRDPDCCTLEQRKIKRRHRVFIDTLRNAFAQSAVAPYAVRAKPGAPVATPLEWDELTAQLRTARHYTIRTIGARLAHRKDPWRAIDTMARSLTKAREHVKNLLGEQR